MNVALTGATGQLGHFLVEDLGPRLVARLARPAWDLDDPASGLDLPEELDWLIHAAAWTDVDGCARAPEQASRRNGESTNMLAHHCAERGIRMVYVSSNEVFPGEPGIAYAEDDPTRAINAYGASKLAGEQGFLSSGVDGFIARTAWLFAPGFRNFPTRILELAATRERLQVVDDEIGNPTHAGDLSAAILELMQANASGIFHLIGDTATSRYEWAAGLCQLAGCTLPVDPIPSTAFPRDSTPPPHAVLLNQRAAERGIRLRGWQDSSSGLY